MQIYGNFQGFVASFCVTLEVGDMMTPEHPRKRKIHMSGGSKGLIEVDEISFTPWKINMEHDNGGLEDDFPLQIGGCLGSMLIFQVVLYVFFVEVVYVSHEPIWDQVA